SSTNIEDNGISFVEDGTVNGSTFWQVNVTEPVNVGTDPINFVNLNFGQAAFKDVTDNTKPLVVSMNGVSVVGDIPKFSDIIGTIENSGVLYSDILLRSQFTPSQNVYVSPQGSDITGNGTI